MKKLFSQPVFILSLIVLIGFAVRWPHIGDSFYGDEHFSVIRDSHHLIPVSEDRFRPLFFTLLYLWKQIGFHGEIGLRLLSLLFGLAQIPLAYLIGKRLSGERLGRIFAILIAASPILIEFSQELRMYSMVAFIALLQVWTMLRAIEQPKWTRWAAFVAVGVIGVYTHMHYWLFLVCFAPMFFRLRKTVPLRSGVMSLSVIGLLYLPNIPNVLRFIEVRSGSYFVHIPSAIPKLIAAFTVGFNYFELPEQSLGRAVGASDLARNLPLALLVAIPVIVLIVAWIRQLRKNRGDPVLVLCYELLLLPVFLALIATLVTRQYWLQPKYLIFSVPFALLLIAYLYQSYERAIVRIGLAVCGLAICAVALLHFWDPQHYGRRENWIGLTDELKARFTDRSALLLLPASYRFLNYYWPESENLLQKVEIPPRTAPTQPYLESLRRLLKGKREVYYIRWDTTQNDLDPNDVLPKSLDLLGTRTQIIQYNPRFFLFHWQL